MISENEIKFSWRKGVEFTFILPNNNITYKNALWTKADKVLFNDKAIKTNRIITKKVILNEFKQNNDLYKILFEKSGFITDHSWKCSLYTNNNITKTFRIFFKDGNKYIGIIAIISGIFFGILFNSLPNNRLETMIVFGVVIFILQKNKGHITYEAFDA